MKFEFTNLGFIDTGSIELNDLTIICGKNNTGKTYISHSIYAILKTLRTINYNLISADDFELLMSSNECKIEVKCINEVLSKMSSKFSKAYLGDTFNTNQDFFEKSNVNLHIDDANKKFMSYENEIKERSWFGEQDSEIIIKKEPDSNTITIRANNIKSKNNYLEILLEQYLINFILKPFISNTFIITSERTGAAMFYKDLDSQAHSILDHIVDLKKSNHKNKHMLAFDILEKMRSRYSLPIRDNIDNIRYAQETVKEKSFLYNKKNVIDKLKDLTGGQYKINDNGMFYIPKKEPNRSKLAVPIHLSSSATKSLYLLDLYIKHIAKQGDILLIDEPELNLHIDSQKILAQLLSRLIKSNIKVVITTHSDHLLREINTLIMLDNSSINKSDKADLLRKNKLKEDDLINYSSVNAYVTSSDGHKIKKMDTNEFGVKIDLFNSEIQKSSQLSKKAYYLIK